MLPDAFPRRAQAVTGALLLAGALLRAAPAPAQRVPGRMPAPDVIARSEYRPGELLVKVSSGAQAENIARALGARVVRRLRHSRDTYLLKRDDPGVRMVDLCRAASQLPGVQVASPNTISRWSGVAPVSPNDPNLARQWALRSIRAPEAQGITIGQRDPTLPPIDTIVAILDSGVSPTHPDLQNQLPGDDPFNGDSDPSDDFGHGTASAGAAAAVTNNAIGIASPAWIGVKILPVKVGGPAGAALAAILDGIDFAIAQDADVINMSFGGGPDPLMEAKVDEAVDAGIVCVASSGNNRDPASGISAGVVFPAAYASCIAVGATGPDGLLAVYSDYGPELDIVAPGGNNDLIFADPPGPSRPEREILSTTFDPLTGVDSYGVSQGTSLSSPIAAGAVAALIADGAVEGFPKDASRVDEIKRLLYESARRQPGAGFTNQYGNGELNLDGAVKLGTEWIEPLSPTHRQIIPSFGEPFRAILHKPGGVPLDPADFTALRDVPGLDPDVGTDISSLVTIVDPSTGEVEFTPGTSVPDDVPGDPLARWSPGTNRLSVKLFGADGRVRSLVGGSVDNPDGNNQPAHDFVFQVVPKQVTAGLRMLSIPHALIPGKDTWNYLFGGTPSSVARWVTDANRYAIFNTLGSPQDPEADLLTNSAGVDNLPVGVGFWVRTGSTLPLQLVGAAERRDVYFIEVTPGWTMIGSPFLSAVPWNAVLVQYLGETMHVSEAIARRLLDEAIFSYNGRNYTAHFLRDGVFPPFDARWVHINRPLVLVFPRTATGAPGTGGSFMAARPDPRRGGGNRGRRRKQVTPPAPPFVK